MENKLVVKPYQSTESKKEQVEAMFNNIAHRYDFLNHFLSLGIDKVWRKRVVRELKKVPHGNVIDIATGTADLAIEACMRIDDAEVTGIDISEKMLAFGKEKIIKKGLNGRIHLQTGDAENLAFPDNFFDASMVAFGVRNFENLEKGLTEIARVLKANGTLLVLEFSKPVIFPLRQLYSLYFSYILPVMGKLFSRDNSAYTYLPESVKHFPDGHRMAAIIQQAGFRNVTLKRLTAGICTLYVCKKTD